MRLLEDKTNVQAPGGDYPYGRIKDNPGNGTGTPVNEQVYGDFHQFFSRLFAMGATSPAGNISANDLPDNEADGFQFFEALEGVINNLIKKDQLSFVISGGGATIATGLKGRRRVPFACNITGWEVVSDQSATLEVGVWKKAYASLPAVIGDLIVAPASTSSIKGQNLAVGPIALAEGDYLYYNMNANNAAQDVTISLIVERIFTRLT